MQGRRSRRGDAGRPVVQARPCRGVDDIVCVDVGSIKGRLWRWRRCDDRRRRCEGCWRGRMGFPTGAANGVSLSAGRSQGVIEEIALLEKPTNAALL
jgi:thiamine pyrophosphate-dependent acetolactate synthase large subunit-like protein